MQKVNICWFRRDLRLEDNAALHHALKAGKPILPLFIFDTNILDDLKKPFDRRVQFIHQEVMRLQRELQQMGSDILVKYGKPLELYQSLIKQYAIETVFTNHDFEPYAGKRDEQIAALLKENGIGFQHYKDHVIFEWHEILKADGKPYTVYTPYSKKWKAKLNDFYLKPYPTEKYFSAFKKELKTELPSLESMGFKAETYTFPDRTFKTSIIKSYGQHRDFPAIEGTSRLGLHLRFGTISIRKLAKFALQHNEKYLNELIWRDFYQSILKHFPHVVNRAFKPKYDHIPWRQSEDDFEQWCSGKTGYPMVDAGMRELVATGYMHNRVRMVVGSFFTKHLLLDWRKGEAFFAQHLLDFDLASNNGGWQWAAGTGCDAAPYFRIFNPTTQIQKFDKQHLYIKHWIPELEDPFNYPKPMVDHKFARERALTTYKEALAQS